MDDIILCVDGNRYSGWERIVITRSMEQGPHEFELELTNAWRATGHKRVRAGFTTEIYCDADLVISGFIDDVAPEYDAEQQTLVVKGRSLLGDLVDCSLVGKQFAGLKLDDIARAICKPFGIKVVVLTDVGAAFSNAKLDDGQSPWEFLDSLARIRAVRLMDIDGSLVLTRAGTELSQTALVLGENILKASGQFSARERFGEYLIVGKNGSSWGDTASTVHVQARSNDDKVRRYRPVVIVADDDGAHQDFQRQADWTRNTHFGRGEQIVYTVAGWRDADNKIWSPNTRVRVVDGYQDINEERMIVEARLYQDEQGKRSELMVMPREAIELVPLPEKKDKSSGWS
jgi:prophage tail gpP-like protein